MKTLPALFGTLLALAATPAAFGALGCLTPPSGLAGWWPGDGTGNDIAGTNNGDKTKTKRGTTLALSVRFGNVI